jgi:hypothetical protein
MELEELTSVGEALLRQLIRSQLRTALILSGIVVVALCSLPLVFWAVPAAGSAVVCGMRLPWLLLGVLPFPFLLAVGYLGTYLAERHEREFIDLVER